MNKLLPFHEAIIEMINKASGENISFVLKLLKITAIPKGHDEIVAAIEDKWGALEYWQIPITEVKVHIFAQKQAAEKKADDSFDIDAIKSNLETIINLIKMLPYLIMPYELADKIGENQFYVFLGKQLQNLHKLTTKNK